MGLLVLKVDQVNPYKSVALIKKGFPSLKVTGILLLSHVIITNIS